MTERRRCTIYMDPGLHRALRMRATDTGRTVSDIVNEAVHVLLVEDVQDLKATQLAVREPALSIDEVERELRRLGSL